MTLSEALIEAALSWYDEGYCILPAAADGSKRPGLPWEKYQRARPTREEVAAAAAMSDGIGMVCGAVSDDVEMLEIEGKAQELITPFLKLVGEQGGNGLVAKLMTYVETTPSGGFHFLYRVDGKVAGNTKLASQPSPTGRDTLIETRGEGGWTVLAPSAGRTHPTGKAWTVAQGSPGVLAAMTEDERDLLHRVARTFDKMPEVVIGHREARPIIEGDLSPGQDYEQRTTWADILEPEGWTLCERHGDKDLWTRPGKDRKHGASATTNYDGNDNLYVFSSSTTFEPNSSYTKFGAYALLKHGGDFGAAAKALRADGFGSKRDVSNLQAESRATLSLIQGGASAPTTSGSSALAPEEKSSPRPYALNDVGNARRLIDVEADRLRFCPERREWARWDGKRWSWLVGDSAAVYAFWQILELTVPADDAEFKHLHKSSDERAMVRATKLASRYPEMQIRVADMDAKPYQLNTPDGVVELLTSEIRPAEADDLHSKITSVGVDFTGDCPRFKAFLAETFGGDAAMIAFVQRVAGYSATGAVTHHILPFLHGPGGNGKSVLTDVLVQILGDYATVQPADFLLAGGRDEPWTIARLAGKRLVLCSEVGPTARFHEQKIKMLTGGDQITARFMRQNEFTFTPTFHLWLSGNHQPSVEAGGASLWRRLRLLPFLYTVPEEKKILGLADQLVREEGPAILAWVIEGARQQIGGLREPEAVMAATSAYAEEEDHLGRFIEENLRLGGADHVRLETSIVYSSYIRWCISEHEEEMTRQRFGRELKARGIGQARSGGKRFYTGVSLQKSVTGYGDRIATQLVYGDDS